VTKFESGSYNAIIHDPPARALTRTDVYGQQFYSELRRILTNDGTLFHYIGNPDSKESGRLYGGIEKRLLEAGFKNVKKVEKAYGLIATAGRARLGSRSKVESNMLFDDE
jgi:predicted methyltransferase